MKLLPVMTPVAFFPLAVFFIFDTHKFKKKARPRMTARKCR